jgi:hypothetical protein
MENASLSLSRDCPSIPNQRYMHLWQNELHGAYPFANVPNKTSSVPTSEQLEGLLSSISSCVESMRLALEMQPILAKKVIVVGVIFSF